MNSAEMFEDLKEYVQSDYCQLVTRPDTTLIRVGIEEGAPIGQEDFPALNLQDGLRSWGQTLGGRTVEISIVTHGLSTTEAEGLREEARKKFIYSAVGNVSVVIAPGADVGHFFRRDLPAILKNAHITRINHLDIEEIKKRGLAFDHSPDGVQAKESLVELLRGDIKIDQYFGNKRAADGLYPKEEAIERALDKVGGEHLKEALNKIVTLSKPSYIFTKESLESEKLRQARDEISSLAHSLTTPGMLEEIRKEAMAMSLSPEQIRTLSDDSLSRAVELSVQRKFEQTIKQVPDDTLHPAINQRKTAPARKRGL